MPIDTAKDTFIELDHGEQLKIEKDTDYLWRPKPNSASPIVDLTLEGGGRCFYYHLEDGIWYCSEYLGSLERIPEFKEKYKAPQAEAREREAARLRWEEEKGSAAIPAGAVNAGTAVGMLGSPTTAPENAGTTPQKVDYNMSMPQFGTTATASRLEPEFFLATVQNQNGPHLPSIEVTDPPAFPTPTHYPAADTGIDTMRDGFSDRYNQPPAVNMPQMPSFPPSFPFGPEGPPSLPSFPPSFPFGSSNSVPRIPSFSPSFPFDPNVSAPQHPVHPSPPFPSHPSLPTGPSTASANNSGRHNGNTVIDGGEYTQVEGRAINTGRNNSAAMAGHGVNVNWSPDLHQERNGTYNVNWSR